MIPQEYFEFGQAGLLAGLLFWAIHILGKIKRANNNPGHNPGHLSNDILRDNTQAIRENTGLLRKLCERFKRVEDEIEKLAK